MQMAMIFHLLLQIQQVLFQLLQQLLPQQLQTHPLQVAEIFLLREVPQLLPVVFAGQHQLLRQ